MIEEDFPFLIGNVGEAEIMLRKARKGLFQLNIALCSAVLMGLLLFGAIGTIAATDYMAAGMIAPMYLTMLFFLAMYNDIVFLRTRVDQTWSNIDVALQKRADLLPQLEKVVKAYMKHEKGVLEALAEMRAKAQGAGSGKGPADRGGALIPEIAAVIERYPELKSDGNASQLMQTLISLENEVAFMRAGYNDAVEHYNARIAHFPELIMARAGKFLSVDRFRVEFEVHAMPELGLAKTPEAPADDDDDDE